MSHVAVEHTPPADATQRDHPMRVVQARAVTPLDHLLAQEQYAVASLDDVREAIGTALAETRDRLGLTVKQAGTLAGLRPTEITIVEQYPHYRTKRWRADVADRLAQCYARISADRAPTPSYSARYNTRMETAPR